MVSGLRERFTSAGEMRGFKSILFGSLFACFTFFQMLIAAMPPVNFVSFGVHSLLACACWFALRVSYRNTIKIHRQIGYDYGVRDTTEQHIKNMQNTNADIKAFVGSAQTLNDLMDRLVDHYQSPNIDSALRSLKSDLQRLEADNDPIRSERS